MSETFVRNVSSLIVLESSLNTPALFFLSLSISRLFYKAERNGFMVIMNIALWNLFLICIFNNPCALGCNYINYNLIANIVILYSADDLERLLLLVRWDDLGKWATSNLAASWQSSNRGWRGSTTFTSITHQRPFWFKWIWLICSNLL